MDRLLIKMIKEALTDYDGEYAVPLEGIQLTSDTTLSFLANGEHVDLTIKEY